MRAPTGFLSSDGLVRFGVASLFLAFVLTTLASINIADPDLWGFLAFGRLFWNSPGFPYRDVFSYVPTLDPWVYHEWLAGVLFYPLYQTFGAAGIQVLRYLLGLGMIYFLFLTARKRGAHPLAILFFLATLVTGFKNFLPPLRPQNFTYFFFAWSLYLLESARLDGRYGRLWPLPVLQIFWCNLHGGFLAGLGLIFLYGLGEGLSRRPWRPYALVLAAATLATLINPYGLQYWHYLVRAVTMPRPMIIEWISIFQDLATGALGSFYYTLLVLILVLFLWWRSRYWELTPLLLLGITLVLGVKHVRHLMFFFMLVGAFWPITLKPYEQDLAGRPRLQRLWQKGSTKLMVIAAAFLLAGFFISNFFGRDPFSLTTPAAPRGGKINRMYYPEGAMAYIQEQGLTGKLLIDFGWGEYAMWRFHPRLLVALDGRFETVYPDPVIQEYLHFFYASPHWQGFLEKYPPDFILIKHHGKLPELIKGLAPWRVLYADSWCILFGRESQKKATDLTLP